MFFRKTKKISVAYHAANAIIRSSREGEENHSKYTDDWGDILCVCFVFSSVVYLLNRVVKARHFYDMSVINDQNRYVKDKYGNDRFDCDLNY